MILARQQIVALAVFTSYFAIIIALFLLILRNLYNISPRHDRRKTRWVFKLLTIGSLAHTWRHMFRFLFWSFSSYEASLGVETLRLPMMTRVTSWLMDTSLFEQAWAAVCFGPFNWWWSQQLCLYTIGAWTVLLATKGHAVKHIWAYMLLGQLVAISVASNLFYLALILSSTTPKSKSQKSEDKHTMLAPASLYIPLFLSLATVAYSPHTTVHDGTFLSNLLAMHSLIFIPLITPPISGPLPKISLGTLATLLSLLSLTLHVRASLHALYSISPNGGNILSLQTWAAFTMRAWDTLYTYHPAQSSIGWDVVWTSTSFIIWSAIIGVVPITVRFQKVLPFVITPLLSVGSVAPWIFKVSAPEGAPIKED